MAADDVRLRRSARRRQRRPQDWRRRAGACGFIHWHRACLWTGLVCASGTPTRPQGWPRADLRCALPGAAVL